MKRITAMLLIFMMLFCMSTSALADDGTKQSYVTVVVAPASYTVKVPQDQTFNIADVIVPDGDVSVMDDVLDGKHSLNGSISVSSVMNCNYIACTVTATAMRMKNTPATVEGEELNYFILASNCPNIPVIHDYEELEWVRLEKNTFITLNVYCAGRQFERESGEIVDFKSQIHALEMCVPESAAASAAAGDYTCTLTFEFASYLILPQAEG